MEEEVINYNDEPVYFCSHCLSLNIKIVGDDMDYCDDCGSTDVETAHINQWDRLYRLRYGESMEERKFHQKYGYDYY